MKSFERTKEVNAEQKSGEGATTHKVGAESTTPEDQTFGEVIRVEVVEIIKLWRRRGGSAEREGERQGQRRATHIRVLSIDARSDLSPSILGNIKVRELGGRKGEQA